jgi:hypothetical protein
VTIGENLSEVIDVRARLALCEASPPFLTIVVGPIGVLAKPGSLDGMSRLRSANSMKWDAEGGGSIRLVEFQREELKRLNAGFRVAILDH